jgi:hypothetical protein
MEKLSRYRVLIKDYLSRVHELVQRQPSPGVEYICAFDEE